ncbi:MAG: precorrin-2 C(20)-methyltransferase [Candidatus Melainabacteria bacterium]|nr:precorrin-2 C(20)-methyltransferase [Candidatus Melainabacteria bacterium]
MSVCGKFFGVGVGPGEKGLLPLLAVQALKSCPVILCPKAKSALFSVAKNCVAGLGIKEECFEIVEYGMEDERITARENYFSMAKRISAALNSGLNVAYLTIGDSLTYSTYSYTVMALKELLPELEVTTFPGVTSYTALAAKFNWPLGQGKERLLILPCPESAEELRQEIESHDIVVLMKIGRRLPMVLNTIEEMQIADNCVFGSRLGLPGEISETLSSLTAIEAEQSGYLATMLIRKHPPDQAWLIEPSASYTKEYV